MNQSYPEHKAFTLLSRLCDGRRFKFGYDRKNAENFQSQALFLQSTG